MDLTWYGNFLIVTMTFFTKKIYGKSFQNTESFPCTPYRNCIFPNQYCDDEGICQSCQSTCQNPESRRPPGCSTFCTQAGSKGISHTEETDKGTLFPSVTTTGIFNEEPNTDNNQQSYIPLIIGGTIVLVLVIIIIISLVVCCAFQQSIRHCFTNTKWKLRDRLRKIIRCGDTNEIAQPQDDSHGKFLNSELDDVLTPQLCYSADV